MKKTIFFDLGNVLLYFNHEKMCQQLAQFCRIPVDEVQRQLFKEGWGQRYERGAIDSKKLHQHFCEISGKALDFEGLMHAASDIFTPNEKMIPILKKLKKSGHQLFILSNTCQAHFQFAKQHFSFLNLFDTYILSYEVKAVKPEIEFFQSALKAANTSVEKIFYIDDIPEFIEAAQSLKIDSHLFKNADALSQWLQRKGLLSI